MNISFREDLILWTSHSINISFNEHLIPWTSHSVNISFLVHLIPWTSHSVNISFLVHLILWTSLSCTSIFPNTHTWEQQKQNKIKKQIKKVRREAWVWIASYYLKIKVRGQCYFGTGNMIINDLFKKVDTYWSALFEIFASSSCRFLSITLE